MLFQLHHTLISLESDHPQIRRGWRQLLAGWPTLPADAAASPANVCLQLELVDQLSAPQASPTFQDSRLLPGDMGRLSVHPDDLDQVLLYFQGCASLRLSLGGRPSGQVALIRGQLSRAALTYGRLEDITYTALAPQLRRHGCYLIHAFAAAHQDRAVIIVGPSGSGKTTAGLSLLLADWRLLANDVLLLREEDGHIIGLPTPGGITLHPDTVSLLPRLRPLVAGLPVPAGKYDLSSPQLIQGDWSAPIPVTRILFPQVQPDLPTRGRPQSRAVTLARLLEASVDQWDQPMLTSHIELLGLLSQQAAAFDLFLGHDVEQLPELLNGDT